MVFGSGLDCSPDEAEEQESYMIQLPSLSTPRSASFPPIKHKNTTDINRKYPVFSLALSDVFIHSIYVVPFWNSGLRASLSVGRWFILSIHTKDKKRPLDKEKKH